MKVIGLAGWSGAGKTTLLKRVIPHLLNEGLRVSVIKHAHHEFDVDIPGKDSWVHRQSGATEVLVSSSRRWALMNELRGAAEPRLPELLKKMSRVDLVIVEGFKREPHRKVEVHRAANQKPLLFPDDPGVVGIATDTRVETTLPTAHLDDVAAVAALLRRSAMSVDEAVAIIAANVTAVREVESVALTEADGRILAHDISAPLPLPPFTNSAVDGFAVASRDLPQGKEQRFPVTGRVQAGASAPAPLKPGQAMRIFTGAPMPEGADTVFMQEDVRLEDGDVVLPAGLRRGANVRPAGEDIALGDVALKAGQRLRPQDVALAAAIGLTKIVANRRIRVAVFSTGNELVSPGEKRAAAQLFDSNRFMLMAMLVRLGCDVSDFGILRDERASLASALKSAAVSYDVALTTGGVSTGEEDHLRAGVESAGSLVLRSE